MKKNIKYNIVLIILAFFIGAGGMYVLVNYSPLAVQTIVNKSEKEVTVIDTGIADAVEKLYDAVVVVGAYKNGMLASNGTEFVYDENNSNESIKILENWVLSENCQSLCESLGFQRIN